MKRLGCLLILGSILFVTGPALLTLLAAGLGEWWLYSHVVVAALTAVATWQIGIVWLASRLYQADIKRAQQVYEERASHAGTLFRWLFGAR